jgi:predicted phosphodiesterase
MNIRLSVGTCAAALALLGTACLAPWAGCRGNGQRTAREGADFEFVVVSDIEAANAAQYDSAAYFPGVCEAIRKAGKGAFLVAAGDISPPAILDGMIRRVLGEDYPWHAVVGNHDVKDKHMSWIRSHAQAAPGVVRRGPERCEQTTYSFDHGDAHFVILNEYYSGLSDSEQWSDVCPSLYDWLEKDLAENRRKHVFVFGHEPIASAPDADNGKLTHEETNLGRHAKNAHRLWRLLRERGVTAYVCGHAQTFSWAKLNGVWQICAGHAQGMLSRDARSTFLRFLVRPGGCRAQVYRMDEAGTYRLERTVELD